MNNDICCPECVREIQLKLIIEMMHKSSEGIVEIEKLIKDLDAGDPAVMKISAVCQGIRELAAGMRLRNPDTFVCFKGGS